MERISQFFDFQSCLRPGEKTSTEMRLSKGQIDEKTAFAEDSIKNVKFDIINTIFALALIPRLLLSYNRLRPAEEDPAVALIRLGFIK